MDEFFTKIVNDDSGKLKEIARELFFLAQEAAKQKIEINEIASVCTMGWQSANTPEMEHIFLTLLDFTI